MSGDGTRRTLVTGAEGFIGSHLVERLLAEGESVRAGVFANFQGERGWLNDLAESSQLEIVHGDIRDPGSAMAWTKGCDRVVHLAAQISVSYSYENPEAFFQTNVQGTLNLLQAARAHGVARFVHTSTSEVYGSAQNVPITEQHPICPQSPYAASKAAGDHLAMSFFHSYGVPVVIARPFNTYGPRQSPRAVLPTILSQLFAEGALRLGNLEPTRDFVFVEDLVDGYFRLLRAPDTVLGKVIQFATGSEISIRGLASLAARFMGREPSIVRVAERERPASSEVDRLVGDRTQAKQLLHWAPRISLEEGISRTIAWWHASPRRWEPGRYYR